MDETNGLRLIEKLKEDTENININCFKSTIMAFQKKLYMICYAMKINL